MTGAEAPIPVIVAGATGRMGEAVARAVLADSSFELAGLLVLADDPAVGSRPYRGGPEATGDPGAVLGPGAQPAGGASGARKHVPMPI